MSTEREAAAYAAAVAAQLQAERHAARPKITVDEIARRTGLGYQTVLRYLTGQRDIPLRALVAMCAALGIELPELMSRAEQRVHHDDSNPDAADLSTGPAPTGADVIELPSREEPTDQPMAARTPRVPIPKSDDEDA